jgi:hypothetical protein
VYFTPETLSVSFDIKVSLSLHERSCSGAPTQAGLITVEQSVALDYRGGE